MAAPVAVTVGTTSTIILPGNSARAAFWVQNPSNSAGTVWIRMDGQAASAAPPSIEIPPGADAEFVYLGDVTAIAGISATVTVGER